jgi:uncharacterized protein YegL
MRRLPIFFLVDVSESMVGEPIQQVEEGLATIIQTLKTDPNALETVWVSIIAFAGQPKTLVPLQEIITFYPPKFPIGSGTSLSKGLGHLMHSLRKNIVKTTREQKGDWKPIVFLFTDGSPTDESSIAIKEWKQNWSKTANLIAVALGEGADLSVLSELTDNVLLFKNTDTAAYKEFFKWISDSIKARSEELESGQDSDMGFPLPEEVVSKIDVRKNRQQENFVDDNFVVLLGKCKNTKRLYLMKYKKDVRPSDLGFNTLSYRLEGAFKVDNTYYELSEETKTSFKVNTEELIGAPTCPCCGNQVAFAVCQCGGIHCFGGEQVSICPWCGNEGTYGTGQGGFDVNRTQG